MSIVIAGASWWLVASSVPGSIGESLVGSIPWDLFSPNDRNAVGWACAALAASLPASLAALLWVQAWRGSPRFGSPRCEACRVELLAAHRTLPERCPECGRSTGSVSDPHVHFGRRRWSLRGALGTFALGGLAFGAAIGAAWLAGGAIAVLANASAATAQVSAIRSTLIGHRSHRAVTDALRFAADGAAGDEEIRREALAALDAFERDEVAPECGLALLLDRFDDSTARALVVDLIGSLAGAGTVDAARASSLLARVRGAEHADPVHPPQSPFLARHLRPRITVEAVGAVSLVSMQIRGATAPGWDFPGVWELHVGERRLPVRAERTDEGQLQLRTHCIAPIEPDAVPPTVDLVYRPMPADADAAGRMPRDTSARAWPTEFRMSALAWSRGR